MREAIYNVLNGDATLLATLTGGVHTGSQISRQDTPTAFDSDGELLPCALVRANRTDQDGPYDTSQQFSIPIYLYQRTGVAAMDTARRRIYTLLHRQKIQPVNEGTAWQTRVTDEVMDARDDILDASMCIVRTMSWILR